MMEWKEWKCVMWCDVMCIYVKPSLIWPMWNGNVSTQKCVVSRSKNPKINPTNVNHAHFHLIYKVKPFLFILDTLTVIKTHSTDGNFCCKRSKWIHKQRVKKKKIAASTWDLIKVWFVRCLICELLNPEHIYCLLAICQHAVHTLSTSIISSKHLAFPQPLPLLSATASLLLMLLLLTVCNIQ